jgi:hypothetical protein
MLVYIEVDTKLANYREPAYGSGWVGPSGVRVEDPWEETNPPLVGRFDRHQLVHVTPANDEGIARWYYAAPREEQGAYNFDFKSAAATTGEYPTYTRTYFILREDLETYFEGGDNYLENGDSDPDIAYQPQFADFVHTQTMVQRAPDENLDSLYVLVVRIFDRLCDKTVVREDQRFGTIEVTTTFEWDDAQPALELGDEYPAASGRYIIDLTITPITCTDKKRYDITTITLPSEPIESERIDERYCNLQTSRWFDLNSNYTLPSIGDDHPTEAGLVVVEAARNPIGQSDISEFIVTYGQFPTPAVSETREDLQYCRLNVKRFYDKETAFDLPSIGDTYEGETVVDASSRDIACGDVREFTITTALIPTPVVTSDTLSRDYCRIITETNYDLRANIGTLPQYGDNHAIEAGFQVIEAQLEDVGCGELAKRTVSYADLPTAPRTDQLDDPQYCRVSKESFYDLLANFDLPEKGDAFKGGYVLDAQAISEGCGDLYKYEITYAPLPTPVVVNEVLNRDYCRVITEVNYDLKSNIGTLPTYGDAHPTEAGYQVIEAELDDIGCGEVTKHSVSYATVPTDPVTDEMDDPQFCKMFKERFYDLSTNFTLPTKGDSYKTTFTVLDSKATAVGCGDLMQFEISYATLPTPVVVNEVLNRDFCRVITETNYDLKSNIGSLPTYGDSHPIEAGYQVTEASLEDIGCGEVTKKVISYATVPTLPVTDEVDDPEFCKTFKERFYDLSSNYDLPNKGDTYKVDYTVLDAKADALGCGDLKQFTITYASLPTPVVTKEDLDNDYCVLYTESNYDLKSNIGSLPVFGDAHPTKTGFQVVRAALEDIGCGEVSKLTVTYANVPTSPKTTERDDESWCRVSTDQFFDLSANFTLPAKGDVYPSGGTTYVINASSDAVGCGDLYRFTVEYAALPTPVVEKKDLDNAYCVLHTESNYDLKSNIGALPVFGDAHPSLTGYQVVNATLQDIGCGEVGKLEVTYAQVPTSPKTTQRDDPEWCRVDTDQFFELSANFTLPEKGEIYPSGQQTRVINASSDAVGCGDLYRFTIEYTTLPTPVVTTETLNRDYCRVITESNYDLNANIGALPSYGDAHPTEAGYQVIEAKIEDIGCGEVSKREVSYATVPTSVVTNEAEDELYCRIKTDKFFDLSANYTLPEKGTVYPAAGSYVVDAKADAVGCGDLYEFSVTYADIPTNKVVVESTSDEWCDTIRESYVDLDTNITSLPALGSASVDHTGYVVVDAQNEDLGCGGLTRATVTYAAVPSAIRSSESDHPDYCTLNTDVFYELAGYGLPKQGDAYATGVVVNARSQEINCGVVRRIEIEWITLPTASKFLHREDDTYCGVEQEVFYAVDTHTLPALGAVHGAGKVIDLSSEDIGCGGITRYTITSGVVPSPVKVAERTDNEQCVIRTETYVELDTVDPPALDDDHATLTGMKVVNVVTEPLGCRGINNVQVTYAQIPSPDKVTEIEDETWGRITRTTKYDLSGTYTLPSLGALDGTERVVAANSEDINCGLLRKFVVDTVTLPTTKRHTVNEDNTYCTLTTETHIDVTSGFTLPSKGDVLPAGVVVDTSSRDLNLGDITEFSVTTGTIPSDKKITERTDNEQCRIVTETFVDSSSNYSLPALDAAHATDAELKVVNTSETPLGCGALYEFAVTYAVIPTPARDSERDDTTYGRVKDWTFYDLTGATALPAIGATYQTEIVVDAQAQDINCGGLRRYVVTTVPSLPVIKDTSRHDDDYCEIETEIRIDTAAYVPPALGAAGGSGTIIDISTRELHPDGLVEYTITSGVIPSPVRVSERLDDEQCRIVTEQSVQLDTFTLPAIDSQHGTDTTLRVVNTQESPRGCRGIKDVSITYAVIPSPPRESERDDPTYGRVTDHTFYDLTGALALPAIGDTYDASIVVDAQAQDVNCGDLRRYVVTTVPALPVLKSTTRHDDEYCDIETEIRIDTSAYTTPALGSAGGAGVIIDISTREIHPDGLVEYTITSGAVPTPVRISERLDNEQCRIVTEESVQLDSFTLPAIDAQHGTDTTLRVVNTQETPRGCRGIKSVSITYAVIPSPARDAERDDSTYGRVIDYTFYDLSGALALPAIGDTYESGVVVNAVANDVNCGDLRRYVVTTVPALPLERETTRHDDTYCDIESTIKITDDSYTPAALGSVAGSGVLIDVSSRELSPGGLIEWTETTGAVPSPTRVSERLDDEQCRIVTESSVQLDSFSLPAIDSQHGTDTTLRVVNTEETPKGCRGVKDVSITYAVIPSPPRETEREDDNWGSVTRYTFYDLTGATALPTHGSTYESGIVISAIAEDVNCGDLRRYVVETVTLPTAKRVITREDDEYCSLEQEVHFAADATAAPALGDVYGAGVVIDITTEEVNTGGITRITVTSGSIPSPKRISSRTDDDQCEIVTETYVELNTVPIPALDAVHPTDAGKRVVSTEVVPRGCRGFSTYSVTYATIPSPLRTTEVEDSNYGLVTSDTFYDLLGAYTLPAKGDAYGGGYVLEARAEDVNCGTLRRYIVSYIIVPTAKRVITSIDRALGELETEVWFDLDTTVPAALGSAGGLGYIIDSKSEDIDLGVVRRFETTSAAMPTDTRVSERHDDERCTIRTESFLHVDGVYSVPAIYTNHPTITGLKLVGSDVTAYAGEDVKEYTLTYAQIPSTAKEEEIEDEVYCRLTKHILYDLAGTLALPSVGDDYELETVVAARAVDVDCYDLRRYEITTAVLPSTPREEELDHPDFCRVIRTRSIKDSATYVMPTIGTADGTNYVIDASSRSINCSDWHEYTITTAAMPTPTLVTQGITDDYCATSTEVKYDLTSNFTTTYNQGDSYGGGVVVDWRLEPITCGAISKQTIVTASIPTPKSTSITQDPVLCEVETDRWYDLDSSPPPALGSTYEGGTVVDVRQTSVGCGALVRYDVSYATLPGPLLTNVNTDQRYCTISVDTQVLKTPSNLAIGDTYGVGSDIVVEYRLEPYKCDEIFKEEITYATVPTIKRTGTRDTDEYCDLSTDTWFDMDTYTPPAVGAAYSTGTCVGVRSTPVCGGLVQWEVDYTTIPTVKKVVESTHDLFCDVSTTTYIDVTASLTPLGRGDADPDHVGQHVIDYEQTPIGCGALSRVYKKSGSVPSSLLSGVKLNETTGELTDYSRRVILTTDAATEQKPVDSNGDFTVVEPYGCGLSLATDGNIKPFTGVREYNDTVNYTFPRVLSSLSLVTYPVKQGGFEVYPRFVWSKFGYSGPCEARITEEWFFTKPTVDPVITLMTKVVQYQCPLYSVNTGPCLHPAGDFRCNFGSHHKKYALNTGSLQSFTATTETDWPAAEFLADSTVRIAYGGYIKRNVYITPPS